MPDVQSTKKKSKVEVRNAEITSRGYLKLCGRGRPSPDKTYQRVSGEKLELLRAGQPVKA